MMDRGLEGDLYPISEQSLAQLHQALVFAPHPDDEIYGCGGTLRRLAEQGATIRVIVLADGRHGGDDGDADLIDRRRRESIQAAAVIGYPEPVFWDLPDRGIRYCESLILRMLTEIDAHTPDIVFAPALSEMHPDHQVVALAATEALRRARRGAILAYYEISATLTPSALVDITGVEQIKSQAMACFASQEAYSTYADAILSLNRFRAFVLGPGARLAEAFQWLDAQHTDRLLAHGVARPLNRRRLLGLATDPQDLPLVSVMIRSMDRPTLPEAIESVARQTYPNIEIVVVDATGGRHRGVDTQSAGMRVRLIASDAPLPRPQAANTGLLAAQGEWLIFLDEDDVFYAHHIERLVTALHAQAGHRAAYAGVVVIDAEGRRLLTYDDPWSHSHLLCNNFLPIHAVLFHRSLIEAGCRFDEDLPVLEDWDFWLQLARHASFLHVPDVSAVYRYGLGESKTADAAHANHYRRWRRRIVAKWREVLGADAYEEALHWCVGQYDYFSQLADVRQKTIDDMRAEQEKTIDDMRAERLLLEQHLQAVLQSTSWRMTAPLRNAARRIGRGPDS